MPALYHLTNDELRLQEALDQSGGEMTPELEAWFEEHAAALGAKLDAYVGLIRTFEMQAVQAKAEKEQWVAKERAAANAADRLKARLKAHLEATGQMKVTTATGRVIALQANGGKAAVDIDNTFEPAGLVGFEYGDCVFTCYEWDKDQIRAHLEAGKVLPFARLLPRGTRLVVK